MLTAGRRSAVAGIRSAARGLAWLFQRPMLALLGRHSLQVYAFHVFVVYAVKAAEWHRGGFDEWAKAAICLACVATLAVPALAREARAGGGRAPQRAAGG